MSEMSANSAPRLTREEARALALAAGFAEAGLVAIPYADEERDAAGLRIGCARAARGRCATWSGGRETGN